MSTFKVYLGVGHQHGGKDPGAVANGYKESNLNLSIALAVRDELARHGVSSMMSRTTDADSELTERIKECNDYDPDLALDIHNNASGAGNGDGAEVFYHYKGGASKDLAQNILDSIVANTEQNSRGLKVKLNSRGTDYFGFIRETMAPAVIVECAFVDNKDDLAVIDTYEEQQLMGEAIAKGILSTLGVAYIPKVTVEKTVLYRVQVGAFRNLDYAEAYLKKVQNAGFPDAFIAKVTKA